MEPQAAPPRAADACVDRHRRRGPRARREAQRRGARRAVGGVPERQGVSCGLARTHARHRCRNASPARWRSCGSSGRPGSRRRSARPRRGRSRRSGASTSVSSSVSRHGARAAPHHPRSELRRGPDGGGRHEGQARPGDLPERRRAPRTRAQRVCRVRGRAPRRPCREGGGVSLLHRCFTVSTSRSYRRSRHATHIATSCCNAIRKHKPNTSQTQTQTQTKHKLSTSQTQTQTQTKHKPSTSQTQTHACLP